MFFCFRDELLRLEAVLPQGGVLSRTACSRLDFILPFIERLTQAQSCTYMADRLRALVAFHHLLLLSFFFAACSFFCRCCFVFLAAVLFCSPFFHAFRRILRSSRCRSVVSNVFPTFSILLIFPFLCLRGVPENVHFWHFFRLSGRSLCLFVRKEKDAALQGRNRSPRRR